MNKDVSTFIQKVVILKPEHFLALAKILDVKLSNFDKETKKTSLRDAEEIFRDMIVAFGKSNRSSRRTIIREIDKCLTQAKSHAASIKNTKKDGVAATPDNSDVHCANTIWEDDNDGSIPEHSQAQ